MAFKMDLNAIDALAKLIASAVSDLKDLQQSDVNALEGEGNRKHVARLRIASAAIQLATLVRPPEQVVFDMAMSFHLSSALRLVVESHVPEIIRAKSNGAGVHVEEISRVNGVNAHKLGHIIRLLATYHVFDEVQPNVFENNRLSTTLDTGKSLEDVLSRPHDKYDSKDGGFAALIAVTANESMRNAQFMTDMMMDPMLTNSFKPEDSAFTLAMWPGSTVTQDDQAKEGSEPTERTMVKRLDMFEWMSTTPENRWRLTRFGNAMKGVSKLTPPDAILRGFDWKTLSPDSVLVDVGGGIGAASLPIVKYAPIKLVIQDRAAVLEGATKFWQEHYSDDLSSGRVEFIDHDFFKPQPPLSVNDKPVVFLLRMIMHNWADEHARIILKHLYAAARGSEQSGVKLVIVDGLLETACPTAEGASLASNETHMERPPAPLLSNWGAANGMTYKFDIQMLCNHNAGERTLEEFTRLLDETGWRITEVHQMQQTWMPQIVAVPNAVQLSNLTPTQ